MIIKSWVKQIGKETFAIFCFDIGTGTNLMLRKIHYLIISLSPFSSSSMTNEGEFWKYYTKTYVHDQI